MAIPEDQLETWSHQGSITQSSDTYAPVKNALEASDTKFAGKAFKVFLQGSYGNNTNIYAESDVDVVIRLDEIYYFDVSKLNAQHLQNFNASSVPGSYPYADYKSHVVSALEKSFTKADVTAGAKAIKIKAKGTRRTADVIAAAQFRDYYSTPLGPDFHAGICFFDSSGTRIVNYPEQHRQNCINKQASTNTWFKPTVRIFKNMRSKLVDDKIIQKGTAPSYFIEGLLYNVPDDKFGKTYEDTAVEAINWLLKADRTKLLCANERYYLVRDSVHNCWPTADCESFMSGIVKLWKDWK